jgi:hypothetical protein
MYLSRLTQLSPPPSNPVEIGSVKAWKQVEKRLGVTLPVDYKDFIDLYGTGKFSNSILPYNPFAENDEVNLFMILDLHHRSNRFTQKITTSAWSIVRPFELYPALDGLLPWGRVESLAHTLFWQVGGHRDHWSIIFYDLKSGEYEVWKMKFTEFLLKLFTGEIKTVLLPTDFNQEDTLPQYLPAKL